MSETLETFPNPRPERDYEIQIRCEEFTSVCPKTGLPDFGEIRITYTPDRSCVELKSLKYYLLAIATRASSTKRATNKILDDLVLLCRPSDAGGWRLLGPRWHHDRCRLYLRTAAAGAMTHEVPIGPELDLHRSRPRDIGVAVDEYLIAAHAKGIRDVRLIHGRGVPESSAGWCRPGSRNIRSSSSSGTTRPLTSARPSLDCETECAALITPHSYHGRREGRKP
jgi:7-cyano-7-deazaguanine reductase